MEVIQHNFKIYLERLIFTECQALLCIVALFQEFRIDLHGLLFIIWDQVSVASQDNVQCQKHFN